MARFSLAHAAEPISAAGRQLYLDPAGRSNKLFCPAACMQYRKDGMFYSFGWVDWIAEDFGSKDSETLC